MATRFKSVIALLALVLAFALGCVAPTPSPTAVEQPDKPYRSYLDAKAAAVPTADIEATTATVMQAALPTVTPAPTSTVVPLALPGLPQSSVNSATAYNNRGVTYDELGQHHLAILDYAKACSLDTQHCKPKLVKP